MLWTEPRELHPNASLSGRPKRCGVDGLGDKLEENMWLPVRSRHSLDEAAHAAEKTRLHGSFFILDCSKSKISLFSGCSFQIRFILGHHEPILRAPEKICNSSIYLMFSLIPCAKKIIAYSKGYAKLGLVQRLDKIVDRFALTIYPYSLGSDSRCRQWIRR